MSPEHSGNNGGLKIVIVLPSLAAGGAERIGANLARMWCDEGHKVGVVTFSSSDEDFYRLDDRVVRVALGLREPSANLLVAIRSTIGRILAIRRELKAFDASVAVGLMSAASVITAIAVLGTRCAAIGCEHTHPPMQPLGRVRELARALAYRGLAAAVALTDASGAWLRSRTFAKRVSVIPNAVAWPLPEGEPVVDPRKVCCAGRKVLLAVGRLEAVKGHDDLIRVFARVAEAYDDWDLVILGEGKLRDHLERLIKELRLSERVFLPGRVGNLDTWYGKASLYVMTSHYEGFPNTLLEAMSAGVPVVAMDCDTGPRDIIRHGTDGLLVPNRDLAQLSEKLVALMGDERERARMGSAARDVRDRFSESKVRDLWMQLFAEVTAHAE